MLEPVIKEDWGGGIFRGRRAPADSMFDAVNALVNDEGQLFRRGGSTYLSSADHAQAVDQVVAGQTAAGARVLALDRLENPDVVASNGAVTDLGSGGWRSGRRAVGVGGFLAFPGGTSRSVSLYAGSLKPGYTTGTVTVTEDSRTITGAGTSWLANVDKGMIFRLFTWVPPATPIIGRPNMSSSRGVIVESVDSNTQITLRDPWRGGSAAGQTYVLAPVATAVRVLPTEFAREVEAIASVGSPPRLIACAENRAYFSDPGDVYGDAEGRDYHELPSSAWIVGAEGIRDVAVLFTTEGVWAISNMAFDAVDDVGNIQHRVEQINKDVILWGDPGIAAWRNGLVVPAIDDVYLMDVTGEVTAISEAIRPLYREYVEAGFRPGNAAVFRGHYLLPVISGTGSLLAVEDVLVCRLDRGPAWIRWDDHAASPSYAVQVGGTTRQPKLFGVNGQRVTDLTGCFDPDATRKQDANGTVHDLTVITNDLDAGPGSQKHYVDGVRVEYELVDAAADNPTLVVSTAVGAEGAAFTAASAVRGGGEADGTDYSSWRIRRDANRIRVKVQTSGAAASAVLRRLELEVEQAGW